MGNNWFMSVVLPYINFSIFAFLLYKLAKKPLSEMVAKRREDYLELANRAKKAKEEAEAKAAELDKRLANLKSEVEGIKTQSLAAAEQEARALIQSAEEIAANIRTEAKRIAATELQNARQQLRKDIVKQARAEALRRLESELDASTKESIANRQVSHVESMNFEGNA